LPRELGELRTTTGFDITPLKNQLAAEQQRNSEKDVQIKELKSAKSPHLKDIDGLTDEVAPLTDELKQIRREADRPSTEVARELEA
jgi:hypothetical protein